MTTESGPGTEPAAQEILPAERAAAAVPAAPPPAEPSEAAELVAIIRTVAQDPDFDVEKLRELRGIHKEWQAERNEKAFFAALARAQEKMPAVEKNKHVYFEGRDSNKPATDYWHADFGNLVATIAPILAGEGLSFSHKVTQHEGTITVDCILRGYGHSEQVTMSAPPDATGGKNPIQQVKSTATYLKRATFEAVSGAATKDDDDDGAGAYRDETITASQIAWLNAEIEQTGADRPAFLKFLGVAELEYLRVADFAKATGALEAKRAQAAKEQTDAEAEAASQESLV